MAKLTPHAHIDKDIKKQDIVHFLGPESEQFTNCKQRFIIDVDETLWPGCQPITAFDLRKALMQWWNPREATIEVTEEEID